MEAQDPAGFMLHCTRCLAGWSGLVSLWNAAGCSKKLSARAHEERCTDVAWHPAAHVSQSRDSVNLATGCADSTAALLSGSGVYLQFSFT